MADHSNHALKIKGQFQEDHIALSIRRRGEVKTTINICFSFFLCSPYHPVLGKQKWSLGRYILVTSCGFCCCKKVIESKKQTTSIMNCNFSSWKYLPLSNYLSRHRQTIISCSFMWLFSHCCQDLGKRLMKVAGAFPKGAFHCLPAGKLFF